MLLNNIINNESLNGATRIKNDAVNVSQNHREKCGLTSNAPTEGKRPPCSSSYALARNPNWLSLISMAVMMAFLTSACGAELEDGKLTGLIEIDQVNGPIVRLEAVIEFDSLAQEEGDE